jgi:hypothetical protein
MELTTIKNSIHEIRGKNVMLDMDLAKLYEVETKALKQAVRRNIDRFPEDFMFQLTKEEWVILRSQSVTLEGGKGNHPKYLPFTFTEQGVAMLSAVLNSQRAIQASIQIMRAFVMIRQWAFTHQELSEKLIALEKQHQQKFKDIDQVLTYLLQKDQTKIKPAPREKVGYKK